MPSVPRLAAAVDFTRDHALPKAGLAPTGVGPALVYLVKHRAQKRRGWLVCPSLGMPTTGPSNVRECENCGAQVLTAVGSCTALVDAGTLDPQCLDCWLDAGGKELGMHPAIEAELDALGLLAQGWRRLGEINTAEAAECPFD